MVMSGHQDRGQNQTVNTKIFSIKELKVSNSGRN
jgi:hypothetical protein